MSPSDLHGSEEGDPRDLETALSVRAYRDEWILICPPWTSPEAL